MNFEYIDENLNMIMKNSDNVLYLRPYEIGNKKALFAIVKEDDGVYKKVQITKEQSKSIFPFEPIYWFYKGPGYIYLKNFMVFDNNLAINIANIDGFKYKILDEKRFYKVYIFATFNDGSATFVCREREKIFQKQGGINSYLNFLKSNKEYNSKYDTYEIIECYSKDDDTFLIPNLQKNTEEQVKIKKLTKDKQC